MEQPWFYLLWVAGAYLLGTVSVGDLVARAKGVDIRSLGTGNPGTANIYREIGPAFGVSVFILDVGKGAAATLPLFLLSLPSWVAALGMAAVLAGHIFPLPWRSVGGTGMAVAMGTTAGLLPAGALIAAGPSLLFVRLSKNPGYTGVLFFATTVVGGWLVHRDWAAAIAVLLGAGAVMLKSAVQYRGR